MGRSKSGSLTGWVDRFVGLWHDLAGGQGGSIGAWDRGVGVRLTGAWNGVGVSVCLSELVSFFSLSLSLSLSLCAFDESGNGLK